MARAVADKRLTGAERSVLFVLMDHMDDAGTCFPSLATIARKAAVDRTTAVRGVARLEEMRYIDRRSGDRVNANVYRLVDAPEDENVDTGEGRRKAAPSEDERARCESAPRCVGAPTENDVGRCASAPGGRCEDAPGVGAPVHLQPAHLTYPIEPTQEKAQTSLASLALVSEGDATSESKRTSRRRRPSDAEDPVGWPEFWQAYPRKVSRPAALKAWRRLSPDEALRATIMRALAAQLPTLLGREPQYRPHAATWLNGERWADESEQTSADRQRVSRVADDFEHVDYGPGTATARLVSLGRGMVLRDGRSDEELIAEMEAKRLKPAASSLLATVGEDDAA